MTTTGTTTGTGTGTRRSLRIEAPPRLVDREGAGGLLMNAVPMLGSLGSIGLVVSTAGGNGANAGRSYAAAGLFLLATIGFVVVQVARQRGRRTRSVTRSRAGYLRYLTGVRTTVRAAAAEQRRALSWLHPEPGALPALAAEGSRRWARTPEVPGYLHVRYGRCDQPLALRLDAEVEAPLDELDPVAAAALHRLLVVHRVQPDLPASVDLRTFGRVDVRGPEDVCRSLIRSLTCAAAVFHSPEQLRVAVCCSWQALPDWEWVKWLPHARSDRQRDAVGARRLVVTSVAELGELVGLLPAAPSPHLLLVLDGAELPDESVLGPARPRGVTVLACSGRRGDPRASDDRTGLRLELAAPAPGASAADGVPLRALRWGSPPVSAVADQCPLAVAEATARRLAPMPGPGRPRRGDGDPAPAADPSDHLELLGVGDLRELDPAATWPRPAEERLRVPIGLADDGTPVHLDLKESAHGGTGPHGLMVGATGSGKSELLRTLVLGLALTHSPEQLNLVLVDFKGGATFVGMADLPHVSAVITNLADELTLVDRMHDALSGEMVRRQEQLRAAGGFASVRDHEAARAAGADLPPMPALFVVVDEFSELLSVRPDLVDLFVAIGRLGRSLGLHLLLATQRLEEGRLRGLESHLSYRIALRTFSPHESRTVIGCPDAYELPPVPGLGLLASGPAPPIRFRSGYVSGPLRDHPALPESHPAPTDRRILPWTAAEVAADPVPAAGPGTAARETRSVLATAVSRLAGRGPTARRIWLPPLDEPEPLDVLLPDLAVEPGHGLGSASGRSQGRLVVPVGIVDKPREQRRDPLVLDLRGAAGHVAVVGGPRSGKSTLLQTLVAALALTTTPEETQLFLLDLGGGGLSRLRDLPHVAGVATGSQPEVLRRAVAQVVELVDRRERRAGTTQGADGGPGDGDGDVFLVVDGWDRLRTEHDDLEAEVQQIAARGLGHGVHVVLGTSRWSDIRSALRDLLGTRLELRLGDPTDSEVDRRLAARVPTGRAGRGLVATGQQAHHVLGALPRIDGGRRADDLDAGLADLVRRVVAAWPGRDAPPLLLLPTRIDLEEVRRLAAPPAGTHGAAGFGTPLLLGIDERQLAPVSLDPDRDPHLLVLGEGGSGRTTVLRALTREVRRTRGPDRAQLVVVDYRRSLLGEVPEEYLVHHLASAAQAVPALAELAQHLEARLPGRDVTVEQLRNRSWWRGPEVFVVVDDYDLVSTPSGSALQPLQPLLAQAPDIGLHVYLARRTGGVSRAMFEPVLQAFRDLAQPVLLLSGDPHEGPVVGSARPAPLPAGRGRLVTRGAGIEVVQTSWCEETRA